MVQTVIAIAMNLLENIQGDFNNKQKLRSHCNFPLTLSRKDIILNKLFFLKKFRTH